MKFLSGTRYNLILVRGSLRVPFMNVSTTDTFSIIYLGAKISINFMIPVPQSSHEFRFKHKINDILLSIIILIIILFYNYCWVNAC